MLSNNMNNLTSDYNTDFTMSLIEDVTPYIRRLAHQFNLDFDDLYQDCSMAIIERISKFNLQNPAPLGMKIVHDTAMTILRSRGMSNRKVNYVATYLYAPLGDDNEFTLADTLAEDTTPRVNNPRHVKALHSACRKLPIQYQLLLRNQLGLKFAVNRKAPKGTKPRTNNFTAVNARMMKAIKMLRADAALAVEVAR